MEDLKALIKEFGLGVAVKALLGFGISMGAVGIALTWPAAFNEPKELGEMALVLLVLFVLLEAVFSGWLVQHTGQIQQNKARSEAAESAVLSGLRTDLARSTFYASCLTQHIQPQIRAECERATEERFKSSKKEEEPPQLSAKAPLVLVETPPPSKDEVSE